MELPVEAGVKSGQELPRSLQGALDALKADEVISLALGEFIDDGVEERWERGSLIHRLYTKVFS